MYGKDVAQELVSSIYYTLEMTEKPDYVVRPELYWDKNTGYFNSVYGYDVSFNEVNIGPDMFHYMYNRIGKPWQWFYADMWTRYETEEYLIEHRTFFLTYKGDPIGMAVYKQDKSEEDVNLAYFGLVPEATGLGLGRRFLMTAVNMAWDDWCFSQTKRLWVYTMDRDHPNALATYKKCGFKLIKTERIEEYYPLYVLKDE